MPSTALRPIDRRPLAAIIALAASVLIVVHVDGALDATAPAYALGAGGAHVQAPAKRQEPGPEPGPEPGDPPGRRHPISLTDSQLVAIERALRIVLADVNGDLDGRSARRIREGVRKLDRELVHRGLRPAERSFEIVKVVRVWPKDDA